MWNDSDCMVEHEYSVSEVVKIPNNTHQLKNTLRQNKGDISTARLLKAEDFTSLSKSYVNKPISGDFEVSEDAAGETKIMGSLSVQRKTRQLSEKAKSFNPL